MRNIHKKAIAFILVISCLINTGIYKREVFAEDAKKYLVLVQQMSGSWKPYTNMVELSENGHYMIKAKKIAKALGYTYEKKPDDTFTIKVSDAIYNTYTKQKNEYIFSDGVEDFVKLAPEKAYTSKKSKSNLCQIDSLNTLVDYKCFSKVDKDVYSDYDTIICFSKYKKVPSSLPIVDLNPSVATLSATKPEGATINIEGVEFPVRSEFLKRNQVLSDWGGTAFLWSDLEHEVDGKIIKSTNLAIDSDKIEFTHVGLGCDGVSLSKTDKGYKLSISVKLDGSILADQSASIVKAMVATISSEPSIVYEAIYKSFTTSETYGINEDTYVTVGDCKMKVKLKDGIVTYYIKGK